MRESYRIMYEAYERIFDRCGLDTAIVEADPGQIGGGVNHEFMARATVGEDLFVECENGDYLADTEAAPAAGAGARPGGNRSRSPRSTRPDTPTIESLAALLDVEPSQTLKCVMFDVAGTTTAVLVPGDREVNVDKLGKLVFPAKVRPFDDDDFGARGFVKGYVGPQGFDDDVQVFADRHGARRERLGDRVEHEGSPRHGRERGPRLPRGPLGGPGRVPRGRPLPDRRRRAAHRAGDRARAHLPAGDEVLRAARRDVRGRGRRHEAVRDGQLRHRDHADHGGGGRAEPRRRRADLAQGDGAVRGDRGRSRPATTRGRSRRPSGSTPSSASAAWT